MKGHVGECCWSCCTHLLYTGGQYAGGHCTLEVAWVNAVGRVAVGHVAVGRVAVGRVAVSRVAVSHVTVLWQLVYWQFVSWQLVSWWSVHWWMLYFGGSVMNAVISVEYSFAVLWWPVHLEDAVLWRSHW